MRTAGGGLVVAGAVFVFAPWHPLAGAIMCALGIAALWRAWVAEDDERRRTYENAHRPAGDDLRDGPD
jgi:hypothetical protein